MGLDIAPIIIDGPNFINRIIEMSIDKDIISNQLTLEEFRARLNFVLKDAGISIRTDTIEFVCSKKLFGQGAKKFTQDERDSLIKRLMSEKGVHVEEVNLPGSSEKGVDTMISSLMETYSAQYNNILLISHDRDFVPILKKLREKGIKTYLIALNDHIPHELSNESYYTIGMYEEWRHFFKYSYPRYNMDDHFTMDKFRDLVANADDRQHNQLRVEGGGDIFYSFRYVGAQDIDGIKFRYETLHAFNGYVGPKAASDVKYIKEDYEDVTYGWQHGAKGYYDLPIRSLSE
jgi:uncharacterized LabA/DUF88 family protein